MAGDILSLFKTNFLPYVTMVFSSHSFVWLFV